MAPFYSNENIPLPVVTELRRLGHDVFTSLDAGNANSATLDPAVLAFAVAENRIVLSHNRKHFLALHYTRTKNHAGMVLCTFDPDFCRQAQRVHAAIAVMPDMKNQLVRVNRPG